MGVVDHLSFSLDVSLLLPLSRTWNSFVIVVKKESAVWFPFEF